MEETHLKNFDLERKKGKRTKQHEGRDEEKTMSIPRPWIHSILSHQELDLPFHVIVIDLVCSRKEAICFSRSKLSSPLLFITQSTSFTKGFLVSFPKTRCFEHFFVIQHTRTKTKCQVISLFIRSTLTDSTLDRPDRLRRSEPKQFGREISNERSTSRK